MKKTLIALLTALSCAVSAQETLTTQNLVNMWDWQGATYPDPSIFNLCCSGGPGAAINTSTNTIRFSWGLSTVSQTWAINNVLSGQGIKVSGFTYSWWIDNSGQQSGTLSAAVNFYKAGAAVESYYYNYGYNSGLTQYSGTETFNNPYSLNTLDSVSLSFTGKDDRFWAGYYGPRVRDVSLALTYTASTAPAPTPTPSPTTTTTTITPTVSSDPVIETTTVTTTTGVETVVTATVAPTTTTTTATPTLTATPTTTAAPSPVRSTSSGGTSAAVASVLRANAAQQAALQQTNLDNSVQQSQAQSQVATTTADNTGSTLSLVSFATRGPMVDAASMDPANPTSTRNLAAMMSTANRSQDDANERDSTARSIAQQSSSASAVGVELGTGVSLSALAAVPAGYDRYQVQLIAQVPFYAPKEIYRNQRPVDNDRLRRGLSGRSDSLHQQIVDQQYAR